MSGGMGYFPNAPKEVRVEPQVKVGDVVAIRAVDWAVYNEQVARDYDWRIVQATIYGQVVAIRDGGMAIASQVFDEGDVRNTLVIPLVCIQSIAVLKAAT